MKTYTLFVDGQLLWESDQHTPIADMPDGILHYHASFGWNQWYQVIRGVALPVPLSEIPLEIRAQLLLLN